MRLLLFFGLLLSFNLFAQDTIPFRYLDKEHPTNFNEQMLYYYNGELFKGVACKGTAPNHTMLQHFEDGVFNGPYISFYDNGKIKEKTTYENGIRKGVSLYYYDNGQLLSRMKYDNGTAIDTTQTWYKNGNKMSWEVLKAGQRFVDIADRWYENGNKEYEIRPTYVKKWYENGKKKQKGKTKNNTPVGKMKFYNEKGKLVKIEYWEDGKLVKTKEKGKK